MLNTNEVCPVCNYTTLSEKAHFEICSICNWEDDGQRDSDANIIRGGPNGDLSLTQARQNYKKYLDTRCNNTIEYKKQNPNYISLKKKLIFLYENNVSDEKIIEVEKKLLICPRIKPNLP